MDLSYQKKPGESLEIPNGSTLSWDPSALESDPKWTFVSRRTGFTMKNSLFRGKLLFTEFQGTADNQDLKSVVSRLQHVYNEGDFDEKSIVRIVDCQEIGTPSFSTWKTILKSEHRLIKQHRCALCPIYVCGAGAFSTSVWRIFGITLTPSLVFVDTAEEAFARVRTSADVDGGRNEADMVSKQELRQVIAYASETLLDDQVEHNPEDLISNHIAWEAASFLLSLGELLTHEAERADNMRAETKLAEVAKNAFLISVSHDIRTPLNGVIGMSDLLYHTSLDEKQQRYVETIQQSGENLLSIINDIFDFSKIESCLLSLDTKDFELDSLIHDVATDASYQAHSKGLELIVDAAPDVPYWLYGDAEKLGQVLHNLVSNAVKLAERGAIVVQVRVQTTTAEHIVLRFSVGYHDETGGLPYKEENMFNLPLAAFEQGCDMRKGKGAGLAICKQLVEMMGGKIGVTNNESNEAELWFTVRLGVTSDSQVTLTNTMSSLKGVKILIVDDNPIVRKKLSSLLGSLGAEVGLARNGAEALGDLYHATFDQKPFEILITDTQMPVMDGEALARAVMMDRRLRETSIVLMTPPGWKASTDSAGEIDSLHSLLKPIHRSRLVEMLTRILKGEPSLDGAKGREDIFQSAVSENERRVLLVEDNDINQIVAGGLLRRLGYDCDVAYTGKDALDALARRPYDLVLMDIAMPEMDGFEATRRIRALDPGSLNYNIPIVALTAFVMDGDEAKCIDAGMDDYLSKPVKSTELVRILNRWIPPKQR